MKFFLFPDTIELFEMNGMSHFSLFTMIVSYRNTNKESCPNFSVFSVFQVKGRLEGKNDSHHGLILKFRDQRL